MSVSKVLTSHSLSLHPALVELVVTAPKQVVLSPNQTLPLTAHVRTSDNQLLDSTAEVVWTVVNTDTASIDTNGHLHAHASGSVVVEATYHHLQQTVVIVAVVANEDTPPQATLALQRGTATIHGFDDSTVSHWLMSEDPTTPAYDDYRWHAFVLPADEASVVVPISATTPPQQLFVWVKDINGNVSATTTATQNSSTNSAIATNLQITGIFAATTTMPFYASRNDLNIKDTNITTTALQQASTTTAFLQHVAPSVVQLLPESGDQHWHDAFFPNHPSHVLAESATHPPAPSRHHARCAAASERTIADNHA